MSESEHVLEVAGKLAGPGVPAPTDHKAGIERTLYRSVDGQFYFHSRTPGLDLVENAEREHAREFLLSTKTPPWLAEVGLGCALAEISPIADTSAEQTEPLEA